MGVVELLKTVEAGGSLCLHALTLLALFHLAIRFGPGLLAAWNRQAAALEGVRAEVVALRADVVAMCAVVRDAKEDVAEMRGAAAVLSTGSYPAIPSPAPSDSALDRRRR